MDVRMDTKMMKLCLKNMIQSSKQQYTYRSFIIIIIIKKGQQRKAGREWYTPYQSEDPSPTIPTYRQKEEKGKESRRI